MSENQSRCGFIAIVGRPNVGKSTLLNRILGQKLAITSRKPQTTRHRMLGIHTEADTQYVFVDTPGLHNSKGRALNDYMNKEATDSLRDVDAIIFVIDRLRWTEDDEAVLKLVQRTKTPVVVAINKVERLENKNEVFPYIETLQAKGDFADIVPISALQGTQVESLLAAIEKHIPESPHFFEDDQITDKSSRFLASEIVREKVTRQLGDELPYQMTVEIESFTDKGNVLDIHAVILVERDGQKRIVVGKQGSRIKLIGQEARLDMERLFDRKIMLHTFVKVRSGWSDDARALKSLGYDSD
ncbi:GTPase Era [Umboniibacter marinipuniceus]|uniref:GTPase Era n=1 Tax=Umboniibacter marinipuniceus TaxID=569599 RepID=A0A3M0A706_9GAMM|nr:GTPase Era [Umboniibacter marinipuniceus]RMA79319.1 GTP-binding protein Era [Umboniibacter marinipuniceus]